LTHVSYNVGNGTRQTDQKFNFSPHFSDGKSKKEILGNRPNVNFKEFPKKKFIIKPNAQRASPLNDVSLKVKFKVADPQLRTSVATNIL
jgi:hypothetical protein